MNRSDAPVAEAERHIREAVGRIARQAAIVEGFEIAGDDGAAERASETPAVMLIGVASARLCLTVEFRWSDPKARHRPMRVYVDDDDGRRLVPLAS